MTQDELNADELTSAQLLGVLFSSGDTGEVEKVQVHLEIRKEQWDQALADSGQAKVLVDWIESKRVG
tara:strand:+ start:5823 stop:6023 length:201 start_codon:yes stop_codon:yes gene_type:complete